MISLINYTNNQFELPAIGQISKSSLLLEEQVNGKSPFVCFSILFRAPNLLYFLMTTSKNKSAFVVLLRGINVGGNNKIKMTDLREYFEKMGFSNIQTYIQSGNVVFDSKIFNQESLTNTIESGLKKLYGKKILVVVLSKNELQTIIKNAPQGFGTDDIQYKYDVIFVKPPRKSKEVFEELELAKGIDKAWIGKKVVYFSRAISKLTKSKLSKIVQKKIYQEVTIRNWKTTSKVYEIMKLR